MSLNGDRRVKNDIFTLSITLYDISLSRILFPRAEMRQFGSSGTQWLKKYEFHEIRDSDYINVNI